MVEQHPVDGGAVVLVLKDPRSPAPNARGGSIVLSMDYFDAYLMLAEVRPEDAGQLPPGLRALAIRSPPPPGKPDTGLIFFGEPDAGAFGRILEGVWLDRRIVSRPEGQRKLFLLEDDIYLQIGLTEGIERVGEAGPIRGAVEGLRDYLEDLLDRLAAGVAVTVPTPLGTREARYLEAKLPDPGGR